MQQTTLFIWTERTDHFYFGSSLKKKFKRKKSATNKQHRNPLLHGAPNFLGVHGTKFSRKKER
jgi:hypothetical protein